MEKIDDRVIYDSKNVLGIPQIITKIIAVKLKLIDISMNNKITWAVEAIQTIDSHKLLISGFTSLIISYAIRL